MCSTRSSMRSKTSSRGLCRKNARKSYLSVDGAAPAALAAVGLPVASTISIARCSRYQLLRSCATLHAVADVTTGAGQSCAVLRCRSSTAQGVAIACVDAGAASCRRRVARRHRRRAWNIWPKHQPWQSRGCSFHEQGGRYTCTCSTLGSPSRQPSLLAARRSRPWIPGCCQNRTGMAPTWAQAPRSIDRSLTQEPYDAPEQGCRSEVRGAASTSCRASPMQVPLGPGTGYAEEEG